jgi:ectoine hydroxylase-related dioxygenase (phytanoyl-CoA dioxygenase family)
MKRFTSRNFDADAVAEELLHGAGAVCLPGLLTADQVARARAVIEAETADHTLTGSHFNKDEEDAKLQRRVWNLLARGKVFSEMLEHPHLVAAMEAFLGREFIMGSICASRTMPGFGGQEPHVDYPYWDLYRRDTFPRAINASFPLNCQATFVIDPFTEATGATAYLPGSQAELRYPTRDDPFFERCERMLGEPGDCVLFYGATWHCAMPNVSDQGRIGILVEFLPKFVKPIEDMLSGLDDEFIEEASPMIRQLLGFRYPWPSSPPAPPFT